MENKITSTTYVPLQPPYQIIKYGRELGMQIGTLIVALQREGSDTSFGYEIETHSHPVVAYEDKTSQRPNTQLFSHQIMEGAVWNYVELKDVSAVCLSGDKLPWNEFISFLWDEHIRHQDTEPLHIHIYWQLKRMGVRVIRPGEPIEQTEVQTVPTEEMPEFMQYEVELSISSNSDGIQTVCSKRSDVLAINVPWNDDTPEPVGLINDIVLQYQFILYDQRTRSSRRPKVYFTSNNEKLTGLVEKLNALNHQKTAIGRFTIVAAPDPYEGSPTNGNKK